MGPYEALVAIFVTGMVVGLPIFALTMRFALKPMLDAWIRLREASLTPRSDLDALRMRVAALEAVWQHRLGAGTLDPEPLTIHPPSERARS